MTHHSHVRFGIYSELDYFNDVRDADALHVLQYSDTATLGGVQTFSVTLPGRVTMKGGQKVPWMELVAVGDLAYAYGWNWDGSQGQDAGYGRKTGDPMTLADGIVTGISDSEQLTPDGYQFTTTIQCESLQSILNVDSVAYWMFYGSSEGFIRARSQLQTNDVSGRMDKALANYVNAVAFNLTAWNRHGKGLGARMGYHFKGVKGDVPVLSDLAVMEGSHWNIMQSVIDMPLHEMFCAIRPASFKAVGGFAHAPEAGSEAPGAPIRRGPDGGALHMIVRPAPFPFGNPDGTGNLSEWRALPLHDFSHLDASPVMTPLGGGTTSTLHDVKNFFLVFPGFQPLNEQNTFGMGAAVVNDESIRRFSYRPFKMRTLLVLGREDEGSIIDLTNRITWRIAGQYNRLDEMYSGQYQVPFSPQIQPGERVRVRVPFGDRTRVIEGYVTQRTHQWSVEGGGSTTVSLDRVLTAETYDDPAWFVQGLAQVDFDADKAIPKVQPKPPRALTAG